MVAVSTLFQVSPLLGLWAFPFPSNYIITSQHAAGIVRETATASTTMVTSKTLISGVLLINSSGIVLCGMITLKCLITNLYVMMHFNYFGLVQYYWALFPRFLALGLGCTISSAMDACASKLFTWHGRNLVLIDESKFFP